MKKPRKHLTQIERDRIQALLDEGHKQNQIAKILDRPKGTISKEISRNRRKIRKKGGTINGKYEASTAGQKARVRRKNAKFQGKKIEEDRELRKYIIDKLENGKWSPDSIAGRMKEDGERFYASKDSIYDWLYSNYGQRYCKHLYANKYNPKKRKEKKSKKQRIPNRQAIEMRPKVVAENTDFGHCEADTIVSGKKSGGKAALAVNYERKAKLTHMRKIPSLSPCDFNEGMLSIKKMYRKLETLTMDNGIENIRYEKLGIDTYFCNPYHSWEKPGVENANKIIRQFIPKGCDIGKFSEEEIQEIEDLINNRPRKSLNYKTPLEVARENNLLNFYT